MNDDSTVLGVASRHGDERLSVVFVAVSSDGPTLEVLPGWQGTRRADLGSQLADAYQAIRNRFDPIRPDAIAVKRVESTFNRPTDHYDARTSLEAVVALAAHQLGVPYFAYRTGELKGRLDGRNPLDVVREVFANCPHQDEVAEAGAAAYASLLIELGDQREA